MQAHLYRVGSFLARNRSRIVDLAVVALAVTVVAYASLLFDIFSNWHGENPELTALELDELIAASIVFLLGMVWAFRRLQRERKEVARRQAVEREIRKLAFHDALTDLPNRRQFDDALKAAVASPPGADASHAILMLDLNGFKRVNDAFGHGAGDEVLIHVASRLLSAVREGDMVARLGGDEFAVLARHLSGAEAAGGLARRIIDSLQKPVRGGNGEHTVSTAIGIALLPKDGMDPTELMRRADIALYRAKSQPHSAARFFEAEMDAHVRERDMIERALRSALENGAIVPFYQPLIDLESGQVRGFEALARWADPELQHITPDRFIPVAEDTGLISELTESLFRRACADAAEWPGDVELAINISPVLLHDPGFGLRMISLMGAAGLSPQRLELEITESALVRDLEAAKAALGSLREAGVRIALDDFGTGYSSLYHLRSFKLDRIKIDRSFVAAMMSDEESAAIVKALIGLGSGLGLSVTAEGVETEEQHSALAQSGCEQAQGFLYSRPVTAADAAKILSRAKAGATG